jgi:enoyl-CoA hydratase
MYNNLKYAVDGGVAVLTIDNAEKMNALSGEIIVSIGSIVSEIEKDPSVRVLIIYGSEKIFGAGADIGDIARVNTVKAGYDIAHQTHLIWNRVENLAIPTIAAVAGYALGACFELALTCDLRVASRKAKFGLPEITLGLMPGGGGSPRLAKLVGASKAKEMMFFDEPVNAEEAYRIGLVNKVVEVGSLFDEAMLMARRLSELPARALELIKTSVNLGCMMDQATSMEWEGRCFGSLFDTKDAREGINAFLEKRKPVFTGQ